MNELWSEVKETINAAQNLTIDPSFMVEEVSMVIFFIFFIFKDFFTAPETWSDREYTQGASRGSGTGWKVSRDILIVGWPPALVVGRDSLERHFNGLLFRMSWSHCLRKVDHY
jgi:hypothetical protein